MKTLNLEQMEKISGGSCFWEGVAVLGSGIASLGTTGFTAGLSWGLTALSVGQYMACMQAYME